MSLTEHIPLPDPARGPVRIRKNPDRWGRTELYQSGFSNWILVDEVHDYALARRMADELNTRIAVARKLGA
jgi:hypothetical protein